MPLRVILFQSISLLFGLSISGHAFQGNVDSTARAIHGRVLKIDAHVDVLLPSTPERYYAPGRTSRADLDKLERGEINAVAFAIAVASGPRTPEGYAEAAATAREKLAAIKDFVARHSSKVELVRTPADIVRVKEAGKIGVIMSFLNALSIGKDLSAIDRYQREGVRLFGLAFVGNNDFTDSSRPIGEPAEEHQGLSSLGKEAVARLNRLGMIIDVSQLSPKALLQTAKLTKAPVVASHSSVRSLVDRVRNLRDDEIDAIARTGGVIHVTTFNAYLIRPTPDMLEKVRMLRKKYGLPEEYPGAEFGWGSSTIPAERRTTFDDELAALYPRATVKEYVDHIDYIVKRVGIDHVGIGSDFNHGSGIDGFDDASQAYNVTRELVKRGYTERQIAKIWGENFLRVFREVEAVGAKLSKSPGD